MKKAIKTKKPIAKKSSPKKTVKKTAKLAGGTSGAGGDKSNTKTATRTATATKTSTEAYTQGNVTVTGGAGAGATYVTIGGQPAKPVAKTGTSKVGTDKTDKKFEKARKKMYGLK